MNMPKLTKKDKRSHAEQVIDEKIDAYADAAQSPEEIMKAQAMMCNKQKIENDKQKKILGLSPDALFTGAVSIAQIALVLKGEEFRALTSKAMNFVHKGRLR